MPPNVVLNFALFAFINFLLCDFAYGIHVDMELTENITDLYNPRPKTTTPTKIPTPTKKLAAARPSEHKVCSICQRNLRDTSSGTCYKAYKSITQQNNIASRITRIVGRNTVMPSNYICRPCENTMVKIEKVAVSKDEFVRAFEDHCSIQVAERTKRMAKDSPQRPRAKRSLYQPTSRPPLSSQENVSPPPALPLDADNVRKVS